MSRGGSKHNNLEHKMPQQFSLEKPLDFDPDSKCDRDKPSPNDAAAKIDDDLASLDAMTAELSNDAPLDCSLTTNDKTIHGELIDLTRRAAKLKLRQSVRFGEDVTLRIDAPQLRIAVEVSAKVAVIRPMGDEHWFVNCGLAAIPQDVIDVLANEGLIQRRTGNRHSAQMQGTARFELQTETVHVRLKDCSATGFCMVATKPGTIGASVAVELDDNMTRFGRRCAVSGRILWQIVQDGSYLLGCSVTGKRNKEYLKLIQHEHEENDSWTPALGQFQFHELVTGLAYLMLAGGVSLALAFMTNANGDRGRTRRDTEPTKLSVHPVDSLDRATSRDSQVNRNEKQPSLDVTASDAVEQTDLMDVLATAATENTRSTTQSFANSTPFMDEPFLEPELTDSLVADTPLPTDNDYRHAVNSSEPSVVEDNKPPLSFTAPRELPSTLPRTGADGDETLVESPQIVTPSKENTAPIEHQHNISQTAVIDNATIGSKVIHNAVIENEVAVFPKPTPEPTASLEPHVTSWTDETQSTESRMTERSHESEGLSLSLAPETESSPSRDLTGISSADTTTIVDEPKSHPQLISPTNEVADVLSASIMQEPKPTPSLTQIAADDYLRGVELYRSKQFTKAIGAFATAIRNAPNEVLYRYLLAMTYYQLDQSTKAGSTLQQAIELERKHPMLDRGRRLSRFQDAAGRWTAARRSKAFNEPVF